MTLLAILLAAAFLDVVTMLALPPGSELNPIAASYPVLAIALKLALAGVIAALILRHRIHRNVAYIGAAVWIVGAASNVVVLA